ncbi:MAG TPA: response regulator [Sediminispirochaeta sp.]|nr:response regulator [Sediminispirochaeta sp.]
MKSLIVEDDFASRKLMQRYLAPFGENDIVVDGQEAIEAFELALDEGEPYDLVCLDIMLPKKDGQQVLKEIRDIESKRKIVGTKAVKVIMTTALGDAKNVINAFRSQCEGYLQKPISREQLLREMKELGLVED